jgi:hypothetical protein
VTAPSTTDVTGPDGVTSPDDATDVRSRALDPVIDLDADPPRQPGARRPSRFRTLLVAVCVLAALGGASLRSAEVTPAPTPPQVVVTLALRAVTLDPQPRAVLELALSNHGEEPVLADAVALSGGGLYAARAQIGQRLLPRSSGGLASMIVALRCGPGERAAEPVVARVELRGTARDPASGGTTVTAIPVGRAADAGGLCAAAEISLPQGWRDLARATSWSLADGQLKLAVADLPTDVTALVAVWSDGLLLPLPGGPSPVRDRSVQLTIGRPQPGCRDAGTRPVVPTGFQLLVQGREGMRYSYVPVGAAVADWLMTAYVAACPSRPDGPSAVRTGLDE